MHITKPCVTPVKSTGNKKPETKKLQSQGGVRTAINSISGYLCQDFSCQFQYVFAADSTQLQCKGTHYFFIFKTLAVNIY